MTRHNRAGVAGLRVRVPHRTLANFRRKDLCKCMGVVGAAVPGQGPAVSQRLPNLVLLLVHNLTEQLQGPHRQQGRDHGGRQLCWITRHYLGKNRESIYYLLVLRWKNETKVSLEELTMVKPEKRMWIKSLGEGFDRNPSSWVCNEPVFTVTVMPIQISKTTLSTCNELI